MAKKRDMHSKEDEEDGRMTYREVAAELGCSFQHAYRLEQQALKKVRAALLRRGIRSLEDLNRD